MLSTLGGEMEYRYICLMNSQDCCCASPLSCMLIFYPLCLKTKLHNFVETFFKWMLTQTAREAVALKVSSKQQTIIMPNVQERVMKHCFEIPNVHGKRYVRAAREAVAPRVSSRQTQSQ